MNGKETVREKEKENEREGVSKGGVDDASLEGGRGLIFQERQESYLQG